MGSVCGWNHPREQPGVGPAKPASGLGNDCRTSANGVGLQCRILHSVVVIWALTVTMTVPVPMLMLVAAMAMVIVPAASFARAVITTRAISTAAASGVGLFRHGGRQRKAGAHVLGRHCFNSLAALEAAEAYMYRSVSGIVGGNDGRIDLRIGHTAVERDRPIADWSPGGIKQLHDERAGKIGTDVSLLAVTTDGVEPVRQAISW